MEHSPRAPRQRRLRHGRRRMARRWQSAPRHQANLAPCGHNAGPWGNREQHRRCGVAGGHPPMMVEHCRREARGPTKLCGFISSRRLADAAMAVALWSGAAQGPRARVERKRRGHWCLTRRSGETGEVAGCCGLLGHRHERSRRRSHTITDGGSCGTATTACGGAGWVGGMGRCDGGAEQRGRASKN